jgi:hypothetical protein
MAHRAPHLPPHLEGQNSWLSKATSARFLGHPLVWSGMTGLFILVGYLWLQYYARPLSDQLGQGHADSELVGAKSRSNWNPDIYRPAETREIMPITRQADTSRAKQFREIIDLENKIQPLLVQARSKMENEVYTGNNEDNAWQHYLQILEISPEYKLALSGQAQILGLLQANAEYATDEFEYEEAEMWLAQLDMIEPDAHFQDALRQRITDQIREEEARLEAKLREAQRNRLLNNALQDADDAMHLSPPSLRVAYDLYSRALELDETNKVAKEGLSAIRSTRVDAAETAIQGRNYAIAHTQINRLKQIGAENKLIEKLEMALSKAQSVEKPVQEDGPSPKAKYATQSSPKQADNEAARISAVPAPRATEDKPATAKRIETVEIETDSNARKIVPAQAPANSKAQQLAQGVTAYYTGDYNTAFAKLHPLAEANSARAQFRLGIMYYQGRTVVKNEGVARKWIVQALPEIFRAAQNGQAWAQSDLGTAYELGIGVKPNASRAASLYLKAANQGYAGAQTNLGVLYGTGEGVKYDRKAAIYWLKKAADQGDKIAQGNLFILNAL